MSKSCKEVLGNLLRYAERQTCRHEETRRGGFNWTICNQCEKSWADDEGGFSPYVEPQEFTDARKFLEKS